MQSHRPRSAQSSSIPLRSCSGPVDGAACASSATLLALAPGAFLGPEDYLPLANALQAGRRTSQGKSKEFVAVNKRNKPLGPGTAPTCWTSGPSPNRQGACTLTALVCQKNAACYSARGRVAYVFWLTLVISPRCRS
jgi:hypothetical protein